MSEIMYFVVLPAAMVLTLVALRRRIWWQATVIVAVALTLALDLFFTGAARREVSGNSLAGEILLMIGPLAILLYILAVLSFFKSRPNPAILVMVIIGSFYLVFFFW